MQLSRYSKTVQDMIAEYPTLGTPGAIRVINITMPSLRKVITPENGHAAYKYAAAIREITRDR